MLCAETLTCRRGDHLLFDGLSFDLDAGSLLQVCGPNGCGKTTLLRILCGLRAPDSGRVRWRGRDIHKFREAYQGDLALVGHRPGINDHLSPQENLEVACALAGRTRGMTVLQALDQVGLRRQAFQPCGRLSSGQRRRTALARLLLQQATVWVLDEPLTGLDSAGQALIEGLMLRHIDAGGACLFTTHQPLTGLDGRVRRLDLAG